MCATVWIDGTHEKTDYDLPGLNDGPWGEEDPVYDVDISFHATTIHRALDFFWVGFIGFSGDLSVIP